MQPPSPEPGLATRKCRALAPGAARVPVEPHRARRWWICCSQRKSSPFRCSRCKHCRLAAPGPPASRRLLPLGQGPPAEARFLACEARNRRIRVSWSGRERRLFAPHATRSGRAGASSRSLEQDSQERARSRRFCAAAVAPAPPPLRPPRPCTARKTAFARVDVPLLRTDTAPQRIPAPDPRSSSVTRYRPPARDRRQQFCAHPGQDGPTRPR